MVVTLGLARWVARWVPRWALAESGAVFGLMGALLIVAWRTGTTVRGRGDLGQQGEVGVDGHVVLQVQALALGGHRAR